MADRKLASVQCVGSVSPIAGADRELEEDEILLLLYGVSVHRAYYKRNGEISLSEQISMGRHCCITDRENVQFRFFSERESGYFFLV
ncbi:MAG: hypothetical protein LUG54_09435 [Clostridiales bacterium]|nr:hypothetical protein [Clostridiales bacterium]